MIKIASNSEEETKLLAEQLAVQLKGGEILALLGDLGSGKTTFTKGLARGLKIKKKIASPTFIIYQRFATPNSKKKFYHFDLYRLKSRAELEELGFLDIVGNPQNITVIEWPEMVKKILPPRTLYLQFSHTANPNQRTIKIWQKN